MVRDIYLILSLIKEVPAVLVSINIFFFFNDTATTEIYTLSLHDALPISAKAIMGLVHWEGSLDWKGQSLTDRKSTRLNSSHLVISYAVFCLKKKTVVSSRVPIDVIFMISSSLRLIRQLAPAYACRATALR